MARKYGHHPLRTSGREAESPQHTSHVLHASGVGGAAVAVACRVPMQARMGVMGEVEKGGRSQAGFEVGGADGNRDAITGRQAGASESRRVGAGGHGRCVRCHGAQELDTA